MFSNSRIHDYELKSINVNYEDSIIHMEFRDDKLKLCNICIENFLSFHIEHEEAWGKGKYVLSSEVETRDGIYVIEIQLNSGDKCIINVQA